ncbi:MAG: transcriptional regulator GcvA [Candidatus Competibacterales bacterium]|nr:transcriptional regulator GcvA [Candidatus Competibacterales bacterium]
MRRYLPSLAALQCFEAAARQLNFTRAAAELHLTQSAVSRQVRNLEDFVRQPLFERIGKRLVLTEAGRAYAERVSALLDRIEAATVNLITRREALGTLDVGTLPTFGSRWLVPRLARFVDRHPQMRINLVTRLQGFNFRDDGVDLAVQRGDGCWPGCISVLLLEESLAAVAAPSLVAGDSALPPHRAADYPMLQLATRRDNWHRWLRAQGVDRATPVHGPCFEHFSMMIEAALAGMGVAVVPSLLVEKELADGRLIVPFGEPVPSGQGYYVVYPEHRARDPAILAFRDWLLQLADRDTQ